MIKTLEEKINAVKYKINIIEKRIHRKKRELKRGKLHSTRQKKFDINIIDCKKISEVLTDSKNEKQTRLDNENNELSNQQHNPKRK